MTLRSRHLLGIEGLDRSEILTILGQARTFREVLDRAIPIVPALRGRTVVNLFFEASTRTSTSFNLAASRLSCQCVNFSKATSSVSKGETLLDTARNIEAMGVDGIIIRHPAAGAPHFLARNVKAFVVNAGDGAHEHLKWERILSCKIYPGIRAKYIAYGLRFKICRMVYRMQI